MRGKVPTSVARATRGLRRPSLDARSGRSISPHPLKNNERAWREHLDGCRSEREIQASKKVFHGHI